VIHLRLGRRKGEGPRSGASAELSVFGQDGFLHYFTVTKWFRLYFIPIIPYSTKHFLACPHCTTGAELTTAAERERVQTLVATTASLNSGLIEAGSYAEQLGSTLAQATPSLLTSAPSIEAPPVPAPSDRANRIRAGEIWSG
jgi:hypothetical protein